MSSSRAEQLAAASLASLVLFGLAAAPAFAQSGQQSATPAASGAPVLIDPMAEGGQTPASGPPVPPAAPPPEPPAWPEGTPSEGLFEPVTPAGPAAPAAPAVQTVAPRPGVNEPTVEVGTLGAPDASRLGLLGAETGGLSATMWAGTSQAAAVALLRDLRAATRSPALRALERRLLLTEAEPPRGVGGSASLLALRLARLIDMGALDAALQLSQRVAVAGDYDAEQRMRAEALLYRGAEKDACTLGQTMRMVGRDVYWAQLGAFCELRADNAAAAQLSVQLIQERGVEAPAFYALFERLSGASPADVLLVEDDGTALGFAMRRAAGLTPSDAEAYADRPAALRALALATGAKSEERLSFAEKAAAYGALPAASLAAVYGLQSFGPAELADPQAAAASMPRALGNALLVTATGAADTSSRRLELAIAAYKSGREQGLGAVMMEVVAPLLQSIVPEPSLSWAAPDLVEAYLAISAPARAYAWHELAVSGRERSGAEGEKRDRLTNLLRVAAPGDELKWSSREARKLVHRAYKQGGGALGRLAFELALLSALGYEVPPEEMGQLPTLQPVPSGAVGKAVARFEDAVAGRRVAEAVLNGVIALGPKGPGASQHATVVSVVRGLSALGLDQDARAIACEALLARP